MRTQTWTNAEGLKTIRYVIAPTLPARSTSQITAQDTSVILNNSMDAETEEIIAEVRGSTEEDKLEMSCEDYSKKLLDDDGEDATKLLCAQVVSFIYDLNLRGVSPKTLIDNLPSLISMVKVARAVLVRLESEGYVGPMRHGERKVVYNDTTRGMYLSAKTFLSKRSLPVGVAAPLRSGESIDLTQVPKRQREVVGDTDHDHEDLHGGAEAQPSLLVSGSAKCSSSSRKIFQACLFFFLPSFFF